MPKAQQELSEINKYLTTWLTELAVHNSLTYFDINKVSEGTALRLLNLLYGWNLKDLNEEQENFPSIDLGDAGANGLAVQVTSRTDNKKIKSTLQTFLANSYLARFPNGLRFLILSDQKRPRLALPALDDYLHFFDPKIHIIAVRDLALQAKKLYYEDSSRFSQLKQFLKQEFGNGVAPPRHGLISFGNSLERIQFFKKLFAANQDDYIKSFVPVEYLIDGVLSLSDTLNEQISENSSIVIYGPSGCGKSALARQVAVKLLPKFLPIIIEAKYYETGIQVLFTKEIQSYGFDSDADFFAEAINHGQEILLIIDGFNECKQQLRSKFVLELKKAVEDKGLTSIVTTQVQDSLLNDFNSKEVFILPPSPSIREAIANAYSKHAIGNRLKTVLSLVTTGLEAKMVGEVDSPGMDKMSRFVLFASFIRLKLADAVAEGFFLMAMVAKSMSEKITFSLPLRTIENISSKHQINAGIFDRCIKSGILHERSNRVSFNHEMFFNFFVAESVARFATNVGEIIDALNAPKNADKKILIIGSIEDQELLNETLCAITDANVFDMLSEGEAGEYCKLWVRKQQYDLLLLIDEEVAGAELEFAETPHYFQFVETKLKDWSAHQMALLYSMQSRLINGGLLEQVINITGNMDDVCSKAVTQFWDEAKAKNISARSNIFLATYNGIWQGKLALGKLFSSLHSNFHGLHEREKISVDELNDIIKEKKLKPGQIYLLLLLFRWDERLKVLYPYALLILKNWRHFPYHLLSEILQQINRLFNDDKQRSNLVEAIKIVHSETQNIWLSTEIFDALSSLGELEEDANEYIEVVNHEIEQVLVNPNDISACEDALGIFNRQFDHPYDSAYYTAIEQLPQEKKIIFMEMALQGGHSSMFTASLIMRVVGVLGHSAMKYIVKWTETPVIEPTFPQDSLGVFMIAHLLLGKYNYPLTVREEIDGKDKDRSIRVLAEIYYWQTRSDLSGSQKNHIIEVLAKKIFMPENKYVIETIWQSKHAIHQYSTYETLDLSCLEQFETKYREQIVTASRRALTNQDWQESIWDFGDRRVEMNQHAIYFLNDAGSVIDLDVLRPLTNDPNYGRAAVEAIRSLGG